MFRKSSLIIPVLFCAIGFLLHGPVLAKSAMEVFAQAAMSTVIVHALNAKGQPIRQGSGVVIGKGVVATNCHVLEGAVAAQVVRKKQSVAAVLRYAAIEHDVCTLTVDLDRFDAVAIAPLLSTTEALKVGSRVYAVGAPHGLELTFSEGIVSGLREVSDGRLIQTSTPISPGSSGGGLFDDQARLVGIMSFYHSKGQNLNFAVPIEWILDVATSSGAVPPEKSVSEEARKLASIRTSLLSRAEKGDVWAQHRVGVTYRGWNGEGRDDNAAKKWFERAANAGYAASQCQIGLHEITSKDSKTRASGTTWLKKAAEQGDTFSQVFLGNDYNDGIGVPRSLKLAYAWLSIAVARSSSIYARSSLERVEKMMSPDQISEAQAFAENWRPTVDRRSASVRNPDSCDLDAVALLNK